MDSNFFDKLEFANSNNERVNKKSNNERNVGHHWHNISMDKSSTKSFEVDSTMVMMDNLKKIMVPDKLTKISLLNRKKAKRRILANMKSASQSKKRKVRLLYAIKLERKMRKLKIEETNLSAQITMLKFNAWLPYVFSDPCNNWLILHLSRDNTIHQVVCLFLPLDKITLTSWTSITINSL
ncbi:Transcription factor VIP1, partial [Mucuna pruriens]